MKPRRVSTAMLGATLAMTSTIFAQQSQPPEPIGIYVRARLAPTVSGEEVWGELNQFISSECAAVIGASAEELKKEEEWLFNEHDVRVGKFFRSWRKAESLSYRQDRQPEYKAWLARAADAEFELVFVTFIKKRVGQCIDARKATLGGESWMTGTWQTKCSAAVGITPNTTGRITLQLAGNSVNGTVYPGADLVGADVTGPLGSYNSFSIRTKEYKEQTVTVSGRFDSTYPLKGSGTIVLGGEVPGYGAWECVGTWRSD